MVFMAVGAYDHWGSSQNPPLCRPHGGRDEIQASFPPLPVGRGPPAPTPFAPSPSEALASKSTLFLPLHPPYPSTPRRPFASQVITFLWIQSLVPVHLLPLHFQFLYLQIRKSLAL